ncbi:hypothetical protein SVAN01_09258 [Stagonosporopsis vannaccii]|nr:hypothetical protein SVAN01_09258 [Stagonosporopsis vannaccii]
MRLLLRELKKYYFDLITTIVPGPASWSYFVPLILLPLGLLVPPSILSHGQLGAIILPISIAATLHSWLTMGGNDVISTDCLYMTLFLYLFKDPRRNFKRATRFEGREGPEESHELRTNRSMKGYKLLKKRPVVLETYPETFTGRLAWAMMLPQSRPLHDWIIGNSGHDQRVLYSSQHPTRLDFTTDMLSRMLPVLFIFLPLSRQLARHDSYFDNTAWSIFDPTESGHGGEGKIASLIRGLLPLFVLRPIVMAMYAYSLLLTLFLPPMALPVLLNALRIIPDSWSPHTWRPHFGPFSAIMKHGIRGFWGQWWHQQMRHIVSEPGRWIATRLGLADHGWQKSFKYMLVCISAFTLSGITHLGMVPSKPRFATVDTNVLRLNLAAFFWIQPVGIAIELSVLEPVLRALPSSMREVHGLLRLLWTIVFICSSCTFFVVPFKQLGYWDIIPPGYVPNLL